MFGQKLKWLRQAQGKSQALVAQEMSKRYPGFSISQAYLSALENAPKAPREKTLRYFCDYYTVALSYFYGDDEATYTADLGHYVEALIRFTPVSARRFTWQPGAAVDHEITPSIIDELDYLDSD